MPTFDRFVRWRNTRNIDRSYLSRRTKLEDYAKGLSFAIRAGYDDIISEFPADIIGSCLACKFGGPFTAFEELVIVLANGYQNDLLNDWFGRNVKNIKVNPWVYEFASLKGFPRAEELEVNDDPVCEFNLYEQHVINPSPGNGGGILARSFFASDWVIEYAFKYNLVEFEKNVRLCLPELLIWLFIQADYMGCTKRMSILTKYIIRNDNLYILMNKQEGTDVLLDVMLYIRAEEDFPGDLAYKVMGLYIGQHKEYLAGVFVEDPRSVPVIKLFLSNFNNLEADPEDYQLAIYKLYLKRVLEATKWEPPKPTNPKYIASYDEARRNHAKSLVRVMSDWQPFGNKPIDGNVGGKLEKYLY